MISNKVIPGLKRTRFARQPEVFHQRP
jgi:hypothetical protein